MMSTRNHVNRVENGDSLHPAARFVTDFTGLLTAVDRLMVDVGVTVETAGNRPKSNGELSPLTLSGTISALRGHAQSFVKSIKHFGSPLDRIPIPCMELDERARIVRANEECAEILNGSAAQLSGKSLFSFVAGTDIKRLRKYLGVARQTNKPSVVHVSIMNRRGNRRVELRVRRQLVGAEVGYMAVLDSMDQWRYANAITDLKRNGYALSIAELAIQLGHAHTLQSMADIVGTHCSKAFRSPSGMIFIEREGDLQLVSQWCPYHIPRKRLLEGIVKRGPVLRAFRAGEPVFWRVERHSNIGRYWCGLLRQCRGQSIVFLPIAAPKQRPVGVLVVVLPQVVEFAPVVYDDLVQLGEMLSGFILRARSFDEALAARISAESTIQSKDEFLSMLSHELKNPMMPILGWAVALSAGTLPADKQNLALEGIVRNIRALNYLVEDLFDAMRISSGKFRVELAETRIQDVARQALTAVQHAVESKKLRISTDISEAIPSFMADSHRLHQVLMNLLNNAVKFTPGGGSISLRVRRRNRNVEFIVSDTGKGIERKFLPFVFERFRQEKRPSKVHRAGLGLGLAIVREIVELHGGSIHAFSEGTDKGATFTVRLPMRKRNGRNAPRAPSATKCRPVHSEKRSQNIRSSSDIHQPS